MSTDGAQGPTHPVGEPTVADEVRRLRARIARLEAALAALLTTIEGRAADEAAVVEVSELDEPSPSSSTGSFADAWHDGPDVEEGGEFFSVDATDQRARDWLLRGP